MILLVLSILISFFFGWQSVWCLLSGSAVPRYLYLILALPAGWAITSIFFFLWLFVSGGKSHWYPAVEIILFFALLAICLGKQYKGSGSFLGHMGLSKKEAWVSLGFFIVTMINFSIVVMKTSLNPWGRWDAWARINLKARFLFGGGEGWNWIFDSSHIAHHDYPLLLSSTIARTWSWMGEISHLGPQVISIGWGLLSVWLLFFFVLWLRGPVLAMIIGLAYLSFFPLLYWSAGQYSDLPLVVYMLTGSGLLVALASRNDLDHQGLIFFAGFFVGSAAWSKNEGILFLVFALIWWCWLVFKRFNGARWKATGSFLVGLSFPLCAVLVLKLIFAGKTDIIAGQMSSSHHLFVFIMDLERHRVIWNELRFYLGVLWNGWALWFLAIGYVLHHARRDCRISQIGPVCCVFFLSAAFYYVLITTPYDISWHVSTALDRLILQLWPLLLFGLAVLFHDMRTEVRRFEGG